MNHDDLCAAAAHWARRRWKADVIAIEPCLEGEQPDVLAFRGRASLVIEAKATRSDFHSDKRKRWRRPGMGMGCWRAFVMPDGLVHADELPVGWGLLVCSPRTGKARQSLEPQWNADANRVAEVRALTWLGRRCASGVNPGVWWRVYAKEWSGSQRPEGLPDERRSA